MQDAARDALLLLADRPGRWDVEGPTLCHGYTGVLCVAHAMHNTVVAKQDATAVIDAFDSTRCFGFAHIAGNTPPTGPASSPAPPERRSLSPSRPRSPSPRACARPGTPCCSCPDPVRPRCSDCGGCLLNHPDKNTAVALVDRKQHARPLRTLSVSRMCPDPQLDALPAITVPVADPLGEPGRQIGALRAVAAGTDLRGLCDPN